MKKLFFLFLFASVVSLGFAQTTVYEDDFEAYTVGDDISTCGEWTTWSGNTGGADDAAISDEQNYTTDGANSMKVIPNNDVVYFFGDKTDGVYDVNFWYYVPTSKTGYFNVEHVFGTTWAFSVEFTSGGTGTLSYNNEATQTFAFPHDTWFPIVLNVDLDGDQIVMTVNSVEVATWTFSTEESGTTVSNVLDCINFYGGGTADGWQYYVDNFEFIEVVSGSDPQEITIDQTSITSTGAAATLVLTNEGEMNLNFEAYPYYPEAEAKKLAVTNNISGNNSKTVVLGNLQSNKLEKPISYNNDSKDVTLVHFTSDITNSLGWGGTTDVDAHAAVLFDHNMVADYIGMELSSLIIFCGELPVGTPSAEVWEGFNLVNNGPVDLMSTQEFTAAEAGQTAVTLTTPVYVNGKDLWAGWHFVQPVGAYCLGMTDAATEPATLDVNYTKTGVVWNAANDFGNFGIVATLTGTAINTWLTLDVNEGVIPGAGTQEIELTFDATDLANGIYTCTLVIQNDDTDESWTEIPVTLDLNVGIEGINSVGVMTFPNPAYSELNIAANDVITKITISDLTGKVLNTVYPNSSNCNLNIADYNSGLYIINVTTNNVESVQKFIKK